jgi:5,10-methylene-tetrahydrofolate dehydrogenase/methenyl tetrahydrofolate cyclohydrolase
MSAVIIDGKEVARKKREEAAAASAALKARGIEPCLAVLLVGEDPASVSYVTRGVLVLLEAMKIPTAGVHAVILGRSNIVGKPLASLLARRRSRRGPRLSMSASTAFPTPWRKTNFNDD